MKDLCIIATSNTAQDFGHYSLHMSFNPSNEQSILCWYVRTLRRHSFLNGSTPLASETSFGSMLGRVILACVATLD